MDHLTNAAAFLVSDSGPLATLQDLGRRGHAMLGVPPSGALDLRSMTLANRLVANAESTAVLEVTFGGLAGTFTAGRYIALTGATTDARLDDTPLAFNAPHYARPGQTLHLGRPTARGLRSYLAVAGGFDVPDELGSRSTDLMSGLGPPKLRRGQRLPLGRPAGLPLIDIAPGAPVPIQPVLEIALGPRDDWFSPDAAATLLQATYSVTQHANRIGIRLHGPKLRRRIETELPPEAIVTGAIQVPPSGQPILFLNDHPTTGGYPVLAVTTTASLDIAAQLRPGDAVRFRQSRGTQGGSNPVILPL